MRCKRVRLVDGANDSIGGVSKRFVLHAMASDHVSLDAVVRRLLAAFEGPWAMVMFRRAPSAACCLLAIRSGVRSLLFRLSDDPLLSLLCGARRCAFARLRWRRADCSLISLSDGAASVCDLLGLAGVLSSDTDVNWSPFPPRTPLAQRSLWAASRCGAFPPPRDEESGDQCGADNGVCGAFLDALLDATRVRVLTRAATAVAMCEHVAVPRAPSGPRRSQCCIRAASTRPFLAALCHAELPIDEPIDSDQCELCR
jgi:hypothetical protein